MTNLKLVADSSNEEIECWQDQDNNHALAVGYLEQAALLLGGNVTHVEFVDSKLNKRNKYIITYDLDHT